MDEMCLLFYYLHHHVLVINGEFTSKNKPINIVHYYVPIEKSKYKAMHCTFMIDSRNSMHCTIISTDKDDNNTCINPVEMIPNKKLLGLKHEGKHFEPLIYSFLSSFNLNFLECHSHKIFDDVEDDNNKYSVESMYKH